MKIKTLLFSLCAVLLVTATVFGTVAYLTDRDQVVNTFTVGKVDITLDEADVTADGKPIPDAPRVYGNEYHLVPGQYYVKDPTVTVVKNSDASYIRTLVTINKASELMEVFGTDFLPENYVSGWDREIWPCVAVVNNNDNTVTYEYRYYKTVDAAAVTEDIVLEPLFTGFTLPGEVTIEELDQLQGLEISVVAHAIQAATFDTADEAWVAFGEQMNP